jgi:hypothetical protein
MKVFLINFSVITLCFFSALSYSHHGVGGQFDTSKKLRLLVLLQKQVL